MIVIISVGCSQLFPLSTRLPFGPTQRLYLGSTQGLQSSDPIGTWLAFNGTNPSAAGLLPLTPRIKRQQKGATPTLEFGALRLIRIPILELRALRLIRISNPLDEWGLYLPCFLSYLDKLNADTGGGASSAFQNFHPPSTINSGTSDNCSIFFGWLKEIGGRLCNISFLIELLRMSAPHFSSSMEKQNITQTPGISGGQRPHVVVYPSRGMGHLIPFVELAKKVVTCHGFSVTFITMDGGVTARMQTAYLEALVASSTEIRLWELPGPKTEEKKTNFLAYVDNSIGALEDRLKLLVEPRDSWPPVCAFITDLFHVSALNVAKGLGLPSYIFFTSSAALLCLTLYVPKLVSHRDFLDDIDAVVHIPGIQRPISRTDLPDPLNNKPNPVPDGFVRICSGLKEATAILVNTFYELERYSIDALLSGQVLERDETPPIYPIGPILSAETAKGNKAVKDECRCSEWLDDHPDCSVIYVAFGSLGLMSAEQTTEIALGLERSQQRFVWILRGIRPPTENFPSTVVPDLDAILPEGFRSRVKDRGLVVSSWAPQVPILSQRSIGGFVSHCGWNSALEGIWCGVPMVTWPLFAEQQFNCLLLVNELKVGLAVKKDGEGFVREEEVERVVRELMEGEEGRMARINVKALSRMARDAIAKDEGSSCKSLKDVTLNFVAPHE